ncbi:hypothetical protein FD755_024841 [Muntiacus reevesi]|uniref:Integrase catalytic domain-containing protein n=1 Tax=Muntiacus reevesi TaxID=9886 RepID=A0A5N3UT79_MUNRE|nr:hypothetical protein FD755_024841 [Muntiacus reevesi]
MPSSAFTSPQRHRPSSPLNGKIQSVAPNNSLSGLPHKATHLGHAACSQVNAASRGFRQKPLGVRLKGTLPLEHLGVDFMEMKPHRHYRYLLVMVCVFSRWVKAFPTWTERASEVARCLLREIVPKFGLPTSTGSGNGPAFVDDLVQVSKTSNIKWKLHTAYRPRVLRWWKEPTGHLKRLSKWIRETDCSWMDLLPMALLRLRMTPQSQGYSPYEIVYGRPPPIIKQVSRNLPQGEESIPHRPRKR